MDQHPPKAAEQHPRKRLKATYDTIIEWQRALVDGFGPGGYIAENEPDFDREHLLWALVMVRAVNGRTGRMETGNATIAQTLGYSSKNYPGTATRDMLTRLGFFHDTGQKKGRTPVLTLTAPVAVIEAKHSKPADRNGGKTSLRYPALAESDLGFPSGFPSPEGTKEVGGRGKDVALRAKDVVASGGADPKAASKKTESPALAPTTPPIMDMASIEEAKQLGYLPPATGPVLCPGPCEHVRLRFVGASSDVCAVKAAQ